MRSPARSLATSDSAGLRGPLSAGHILQMIRERELSRAEIARVTGLARSTVSLRVGALLELGLITEEGDGPSTGQAARPRGCASIAPAAWCWRRIWAPTTIASPSWISPVRC
jgi:DNA-binding transcriptional ArsR family regulator